MGEVPKLRELVDSGEVSNIHQIPPLLVLSGIVGVAVNFSSFFVIQYISSLMAKLIVVARSAALVVYFILAEGEEFTWWQLVGYSITLCAFAGYSALQANEKVANEQKPSRNVKAVGTEHSCIVELGEISPSGGQRLEEPKKRAEASGG